MHPTFIINYKNYEEIAGQKGIRLAKLAEAAGAKYGIDVAIAPPQWAVSEISRACSIPVLAQHCDDAGVGSTTGYVVPEMLKSYGAAGSIINHSEHRIPEKQISELVERLRKLGMVSVVCAASAAEVGRYSMLGPTYVAVEPPELIGSGRAVSKERPELITDSIKEVSRRTTATKLLCGAGIVSGEDVARAMQLGASGILVASGVVKAKDPGSVIEEFAKAMKERPRT